MLLRFPVPLILPLALAAGCNGPSDLVVGDQGDMVSLPDMSQGGPTLDPGVISQSLRSAEEAETHVAVAPNGWLAVAYIGLNRSGVSNNGFRFSRDDGQTFEPANSIGSPGTRVASDPVLAADAQSNFYLTWVGFRFNTMGQPVDMHIYAAKAPAGSVMFGSPVEVTASLPPASYDKPWIMVTNQGAVLVTYARTSTGAIFAGRSTDFASWDNEVIVEDGGFRNLVFPCAPSTGQRIYASYHAGGGIGLRWSDDDGVTWPDTNKTAVADSGERPAFDDPTCAAQDDEVWVTYGLSRDPFSETNSAKLYSIRLAHSGDGGRTVDQRHDAHDPDAADYFMHPYLVREASGALDLVYYAGSADPDSMGSFRRSRSTDGGKTWAPSIVVKAPLTFLGARNDPKWLGDYAGLAWARDNLYTAYVDNSSGLSHVAFYRTASPPL